MCRDEGIVSSQPVVPCGGRVLRNGTPVNRVRAGRQQLSAGTPCAADSLAVAPSAGLPPFHVSGALSSTSTARRAQKRRREGAPLSRRLDRVGLRWPSSLTSPSTAAT